MAWRDWGKADIRTQLTAALVQALDHWLQLLWREQALFSFQELTKYVAFIAFTR